MGFILSHSDDSHGAAVYREENHTKTVQIPHDKVCPASDSVHGRKFWHGRTRREKTARLEGTNEASSRAEWHKYTATPDLKHPRMNRLGERVDQRSQSGRVGVVERFSIVFNTKKSRSTSNHLFQRKEVPLGSKKMRETRIFGRGGSILQGNAKLRSSGTVPMTCSYELPRHDLDQTAFDD